jgi:hypothetical protein
MTTTTGPSLNAAIAHLEAGYNAFPMPIASGLAIGGLVIILGVLSMMLVMSQETFKMRGAAKVMIVLVPCLVLVSLLVGYQAISNHQLAEIEASRSLSYECHTVHMAAENNPDQVPTTQDVRFVSAICGQQTLQTISAENAPPADADQKPDEIGENNQSTVKTP